jgi:hypothetical protein
MINYTFFSSDFRPRYANDVLNVLALPKGYEYKFRYEQSYIEDSIRHTFHNDSKEFYNADVLLAFKSSNSNFVVPVRWARIIKVNKVTDFYNITYVLLDYPEIDSLLTLPDVQKASELFFNSIPSSDRDKAVINKFPQYLKPLSKNTSSDNWINICKVLSLYPKFETNHFLRFSDVHKKDTILKFKDNSITLQEVSVYSIICDYYSGRLSVDSILSTNSSSDKVKIVSNGKIDLNNRYDTVEILFETDEVPKDTFFNLAISTRESKNCEYFTNCNFLFRIQKQKFSLIYKIATSVVGGLVLSLPTLLKDFEMNVYLKIALILLGSLILSLGVNLKFYRK